MERIITEREVDDILTRNRFINSERDLKRRPLEGEKGFIDKVRQGKYREITFIDYEELEKNMGASTVSKLKRFEYTTVTGIALTSRAAMESGMRPDDVFDISDAMLARLERARDGKEMHDILVMCAVLFAHGVYMEKQKKSSYQIEMCKNYISRNIFKKIYLDDIASYVGLNPRYLSSVFSEKEGITIRSYIQREKMNVAANLLKYSDQSVAEIVQYMGIQSQSNFSELFKKWHGMTPVQFRQKNKKSVF